MGKAEFRVHPTWRRPAADLLSAFGTASSAQVADSMSRLGAMDAGIKQVWPSPRILGAALTVWCHSGDNLMLHKALSIAAPGDIIVMNTQGNVANSGFGELIATSAKKIGILAVIIDGTVRDAEALIKATASELGEKAKEARARLIEALDAAKVTCHKLEEKAIAGAKATDRIIREHPYQSLGLAFGLGLLIGVLVNRK